MVKTHSDTERGNSLLPYGLLFPIKIQLNSDEESYTNNQPALHDWCNKSHGMCYPVCGMVHIKEPLLLIRCSSPCGGSRFPLSLSEWSSTICVMPYNRK